MEQQSARLRNTGFLTFFFSGICAISAGVVVSLLQEKGYKLRESLDRQNIVFRWAVYLTAVYAVIIFGVYGIGFDAASFIYQGF